MVATSALRCFVLLTVAAAYQTGPDDHKRIMRTETLSGSVWAKALELGSYGELAGMGKRTDPTVPQAPCDREYPLGKPDSSECLQAHHDLITDPEMCEHAAKMTHANIDVSKRGSEPFEVSEEWWDSHPMGCFAWKCAWDYETNTGSEKMCYFFNRAGYDPCTKGACGGTPVCYAAKYRFGGADSNGGCPASYQVINDEHTCRASGSCQSIPLGVQFLIGEGGVLSQHDEFPEGCFISKVDGKVYFNNPTADGWGTPANPKGTPLCNVSEDGHMWTGAQATIVSPPPVVAVPAICDSNNWIARMTSEGKDIYEVHEWNADPSRDCHPGSCGAPCRFDDSAELGYDCKCACPSAYQPGYDPTCTDAPITTAGYNTNINEQRSSGQHAFLDSTKNGLYCTQPVDSACCTDPPCR